jgi:hypothetical protein
VTSSRLPSRIETEVQSNEFLHGSSNWVQTWAKGHPNTIQRLAPTFAGLPIRVLAARVRFRVLPREALAGPEKEIDKIEFGFSQFERDRLREDEHEMSHSRALRDRGEQSTPDEVVEHSALPFEAILLG